MGAIGIIVSSFGRNFLIEHSNIIYTAISKAKNTDYVVGDVVDIEFINQQQVIIKNINTRNNLVFRSDMVKQKSIASNITQLVIVIAIKPNFNINLLNSFLLHAEYLAIKPLIVINKIELEGSNFFVKQIENLYNKQISYETVKISAIHQCDELLPSLLNKNNLLIGQSGMGKSTIINSIITNANTRTNQLAKSEKTGQHTTTNATMYHINNTSHIIDCPGLQDFGLYHLKDVNLLSLMPDLTPYTNQCKFRNCKHLNEPNCAIIDSMKKNEIDKSRFEFLQHITKILSKNHY